MAHITEVRRALAALIADAGNVTVYPGPSTYAADNGLDSLCFIARVTVGPETAPESAERLDALLSPGADCVKARLEADHTLGGLISDVSVTKSTGYLTFGDQLGAEWTVATLA